MCFANIVACADADTSRMRTLVRADGAELTVLVSVGVLRDDAGTASGAVLVAWQVDSERLSSS